MQVWRGGPQLKLLSSSMLLSAPGLSWNSPHGIWENLHNYFDTCVNLKVPTWECRGVNERLGNPCPMKDRSLWINTPSSFSSWTIMRHVLLQNVSRGMKTHTPKAVTSGPIILGLAFLVCLLFTCLRLCFWRKLSPKRFGSRSDPRRQILSMVFWNWTRPQWAPYSLWCVR